jgi:hypothetical protein
MKIKTFILLTAIIMLSLTLFPAEQTTGLQGINYSAGLVLSHHRVPVTMGDADLENTFVFSYLAVEVDMDIHDYLTVGALAGYNRNNFADPVNFLQLPLSLGMEESASNSMMFGLRAKSNFFSWQDFSFSANTGFLYGTSKNKEYDIALPIVSGTAEVSGSFYQAHIELLVRYDGLSHISLFAGPRLNLLKGTLTASETIEDLEGEEELDYGQKNMFGITAGAHYEAGASFDINLKLSLVSQTSLTLELLYIF